MKILLSDEVMVNREESFDQLSSLPAGILVHHSVAQGGHYFSFIRDRLPEDVGNSKMWYSFDESFSVAIDWIGYQMMISF